MFYKDCSNDDLGLAPDCFTSKVKFVCVFIWEAAYIREIA